LSLLKRIAAELEGAVGAGRVPADADPVALLDAFERIGRVAEAGRLAALAAVERLRAWQGGGHESVTQWAAERSGVTMGHAIASVKTAKALASAPATRSALAAGRVSVQQAAEIAQAAQADPASEATLLAAASAGTAAELREKCRMVRAAAAGDDEHERVHRTRSLRFRADGPLAVRVDGRMTADQAAPMMVWLQAAADRRAAESRRAGVIEPHEAHMADAFCSMPAKIGSGGSAKDVAVRATVYVYVDQPAWDRGRAEPGERCEIAGVGPTTVAAARRLAAQPGGMLKIAIRNDGNLSGVVNTGRYVPALVRSALEARDERCAIKGCTRRRGLERDHRIEYGRGGPTSLENLHRLCAYHHSLKTHLGWRIEGDPPNCRMIRPAGQEKPP